MYREKHEKKNEVTLLNVNKIKNYLYLSYICEKSPIENDYFVYLFIFMIITYANRH